ncbi:MAG: metal ABC transporter permease [Planctomycetota bacterium]|nr:metal ABC transporter permease [Planctomycetaceae bacterium]MDQ3330231.1 metal ABC transporter permease [Planctomycetota bacterium]
MNLLLDYNTRVVLLGTLLLGATAGLVGTFLVLRKRALVGDVIGHATLPGIAIAFLFAEMFSPGTGKNTATVMLGAAATGLLGAAAVSILARVRKVGPDAAQAVVLGLFFGVGASLFRVVQQVPTGNAAGLNGYLYGKAASLVASDVWLFAGAAAVVLLVVLALHKEFVLVCFDAEFATATGRPVKALDLALTALAVAVTVLGLQSVGLVLVVATLTIPPATARFWTDRAGVMTALSAAIGGATAVAGVLVSALAPRIAAGATIVLAAGFCFAVSLVFGPKGGLLSKRTASVATRAA